MAKQIVWSYKAQDDRKEIFTYWNDRNKSNLYSKKLNVLFKAAFKLISKFPRIGRPTEIENVRIKIVRDYLIVYEETPTEIYVLRIWDGQQDPNKLEIFLQ